MSKIILRELREEKGLSQIELAKILDVNNSTVSHWELGIREMDLATMIKVCDYFKISLDDFVNRKGY